MQMKNFATVAVVAMASTAMAAPAAEPVALAQPEAMPDRCYNPNINAPDDCKHPKPKPGSGLGKTKACTIM